MRKWEKLATAKVPGGGVLDLLRGGPDAWAIHVDGLPLMDCRAHGSEDALGEVTCARIADRPGARVLVGGLGMGFTLAATLRTVRPDAEVVVAELVPEVVAWNRGELGAFAGRPLDDPRVTVRERDVGQVIRAAPSAWDAILLDVDNGPDGLAREQNDWLYGPSGLGAIREALRPGGVLSVWSSAPDAAFKRRLYAAGFEVDEVVSRARGAQGGRKHWIWLATA
jgi:spermidine synthase